MSYLYLKRNDSHLNLHAVTKRIEEKIQVTLRDQDIRILLDELVLRGLVEKSAGNDSNVYFQISTYGIGWWEKHGEALSNIM